MHRQANRWPIAAVVALTWLFTSVAHAEPLVPVSDGHLGAASGYFNDSSYQYYINTDNGHFYKQYSNFPWEDIGSTSNFGSQTDGPGVLVMDFSSFSVGSGVRVSIFGSNAAAIVTTGDISIAGLVSVSASGGAGGYGGSPGFYAPSVNGGSGGSALTGGGGGWVGGGFVPSGRTPWGFEYDSAGGGAGGGGATNGEAGHSGSLGRAGGTPGQARPNDPNVLLGGGGGGGGGFGPSNYPSDGGAGGHGGGALLLAAAGNILITATGEVRADGANGTGDPDLSNGGGGGGGGGYLLFDTPWIFENDGIISARGGAGRGKVLINEPFAIPGASAGGGGAGGRVVIDPLEIINNGVIDISGVDPEHGGAFAAIGAPVTGQGEVIGEAPPTVPEPGTMLLLSTGVTAMIVVRRRRARSAQPPSSRT